MALDCGRILNSCNGLILSHFPREAFNPPLVIINPLTKQRSTLPPYKRSGRAHHTIAFAEASKKYKVVGSHQIWQTAKIIVLTIGVDSAWRDICVDHLTLEEKTAVLHEPPYVAGGYIHWVGIDFLLTLNVETEELRQVSLRKPLRRRNTNILPMGGKLSAVRREKFSVYVWEMDSESGEWTLLHCIDLKPMGSIFYDSFRKAWKPLWPLGWLVAGEVLVLVKAQNGAESYAAYNVKTKGFQSLAVSGIWSIAYNFG